MQPHSARFSPFPYIYILGGSQIFTRTVPVYYGHAGFNSGVRCGWDGRVPMICWNCRRACANQISQIFFHNRIFYKLYRKNYPELYVSYYPPTFSCRLGFFASSYFHLHCLHCRACTSWTPRARPQHRPLHTAGTHRRDTCPPFPFSMPALSPPATLSGAYSKGIA